MSLGPDWLYWWERGGGLSTFVKVQQRRVAERHASSVRRAPTVVYLAVVTLVFSDVRSVVTSVAEHH